MKPKRVTAMEAVRFQIGYWPKHYQGAVTVGKQFHVLRRRFKTATEAQAWARRFANRCNHE